MLSRFFWTLEHMRFESSQVNSENQLKIQNRGTRAQHLETFLEGPRRGSPVSEELVAKATSEASAAVWAEGPGRDDAAQHGPGSLQKVVDEVRGCLPEEGAWKDAQPWRRKGRNRNTRKHKNCVERCEGLLRRKGIYRIGGVLLA